MACRGNPEGETCWIDALLKGGFSDIIQMQSWRPSESTRDGAASEAIHVNDTSVTTIWVSTHDPVNGLSFKPYPLKSVPLFMDRPAARHDPN